MKETEELKQDEEEISKKIKKRYRNRYLKN